MLSVGLRIPEKNILLSTGTPKQKVAMLDAAKMLARKFQSLCDRRNTSVPERERHPERNVYWPSEEGKQPQALTACLRKDRDGSKYPA